MPNIFKQITKYSRTYAGPPKPVPLLRPKSNREMWKEILIKMKIPNAENLAITGGINNLSSIKKKIFHSFLLTFLKDIFIID